VVNQPSERANGSQPGDEEQARAAPRLHGDLLTTSLLAFLKSYNAYGYELTQRLIDAGLTNFDSGTVYRTLRQLEKAGMVSSFWDTSDQGPARRVYTITAAGETFLASWIQVMESYQAVLRQAMGAFAPPASPSRDDDERA
jgi:PadR family transcriptional regulator, regulatory protein PadR